MKKEVNHAIRKRFNEVIYHVARYMEILLSVVILGVIALVGIRLVCDVTSREILSMNVDFFTEFLANALSLVVRIRRQDDEYYLTYKSKGFMTREEYNLPLTKDAYLHLKPKADGLVISKTRYLIPEKNRLTIELDVFHQEYEGLLLAEVEFSSQEEAESYCPPDWFGEDVTFSVRYHNSTLSRGLTEK